MSALESQITKNVMRHLIKFTEDFNLTKKSWNSQSYYWAGERMGHLLVMATAKKNIIYQSEIDAGIEIDFGGEEYFIQ